MATHQQRIARAVQRRTGSPYNTCLDVVRQAAAAGRIPYPIRDADEAALAVIHALPEMTGATLDRVLKALAEDGNG